MKHHSALLCICLLFFYTATATADDYASFNPHGEFLLETKPDYCTQCHVKLPQQNKRIDGQYHIPDMNTFKVDAITMCTHCHGEENSSHIVGVTQDYNTPPDLPLDANNKITCLTCHYVHGNLQTNAPMASISFLDHIMDRERLSKSFVLRRNNSNGDLCLACHK